jgi:hypothetical protein
LLKLLDSGLRRNDALKKFYLPHRQVSFSIRRAVFLARGAAYKELRFNQRPRMSYEQRLGLHKNLETSLALDLCEGKSHLLVFLMLYQNLRMINGLLLILGRHTTQSKVSGVSVQRSRWIKYRMTNEK